MSRDYDQMQPQMSMLLRCCFFFPQHDETSRTPEWSMLHSGRPRTDRRKNVLASKAANLF